MVDDVWCLVCLGETICLISLNSSINMEGDF